MDDSAAELPLTPPPLPSDNTLKLRAMRAEIDRVTARSTPDERLRAAQLAREMGDVWRAEKLLNEVLRARPGDRTARLLLADTLRQEARFAEARAIYEGLFKENPQDVAIYLHMANLELAQSHRAEAWKWLEQGVRNCAQTADNLTLLARHYQDWNDFVGADAALDRALKIAPDDPNPLLQRASLYFQHGRVVESQRILENLLKKRPDDGVVCRLLAATLINPSNPKQDFNRARELLEKAVGLNVKDPEIYRLAGVVYKHFRLYRLAAQAYDALLTLDPASTDGRYELGQVYALLNKPELSRAQLAMYYRLHHPEREITILYSTMSDHPRDPQAHIAFGVALEGNGDLGGAMREYQIASELPGGRVRARAKLARLYARLGWGKPEDRSR
jgi:predicted Zn-dependent protease